MKKMPFLCASLLCLTETLFCLPQDPSVTEGTAHIHHKNKKSLVIKTSEKAIINYKSFNIDIGEKVEFIQPSSTSCVLNRVTGKEKSSILGKMESNGSIFLVNPNGIYFGKESQVKVGSLIASTLNIADEHFMQDHFSFSLQDKNNLQAIYNEGFLSASQEGAIVLMAPIIKNKGSITAHAGQVVLASGQHVTLSFQENKLLSFSVEGEIKDAVLEHLGSIQAKEVSLKLPIAKKAIKEVMNHDGIEPGVVFVEENGKILLAAESSIQVQKLSLQGSFVEIQGTVNATSQDNKGGSIEVAGKDILIDKAKLDVSGHLGGGSVFIGGDFKGEGNMPYASKVEVLPGSTLLANATSSGDGGLIVLWSKEQTSFEGSCQARGGPLGGRGGIVESSSLGNLFIEKASVETLAPLGEIGKWLIDPTFLRISSIGVAPPSGCSTSADIAASTLESQSSTVTLCANTILQEVPISMSVPGAGLTFQSPSDSVGVLILQNDIITKGGPIDMSGMETTLLQSITMSTTNGGSSGANILIGNMNADSNLASLTLDAGTANVFLDKLGDTDPLGAIQISAAQTQLCHIFTNSLPITIPGAVLLEGSAIINTSSGGSGASITLGSVDASSLGSDSLTLNAGSTGSLSLGPVGSSVPLGNFTLESASSANVQDITSFSGSIDLLTKVTLTEPLTTFSILQGEGLSGISIAAVEGTSPYSESLTLSTTSQDSILLAEMGLATPLNQIALTSNQSLSIGDIRATSFTVTSKTGLTTLEGDIITAGAQGVSIETGELILKGLIATDNLSLVASGFIISKGTQQKILVSPTGTTYINSLSGPLGRKNAPISIITENRTSPIVIGARELASLSGLPHERKLIAFDPTNAPCFLFFNGHLIRDCNRDLRLIFELLPKIFFNLANFNSQRLGIGSNLLAQLGPYFLSSYYTEHFLERVVNPERIEEIKCGQNREHLEDKSPLPVSEDMSSEDAIKL